MFRVPEKHRITPKAARDWKRRGAIVFPSTEEGGNNGQFLVRGRNPKTALMCIVADGNGWEHVSVSVKWKGNLQEFGRCPTWEEMSYVKSLFWEDNDVVVQYHPAKEDYVDFHPTCLHLWRPIGVTIPTPPPAFVGPRL